MKSICLVEDEESLSDLIKVGNKWRLMNDKEVFSIKSYLANKSTKEFIEELEIKFGKIKINAKGKGQHTWVHPLFFIDVALAINPKLMYTNIQYKNY